MALLLNGKLFNPSSTAEDEMTIARQHYSECVKDIREKYGKYGYVKIIRRRPRKRNESGYWEPTPAIIFPARVHTNVQFPSKATTAERDRSGGLESWEYSSSTPVKKDGEYRARPGSFKFTMEENVYYLDKDMDLIYFLLMKSPQVFYPEAVNKYGKRAGGSLTVDDRDTRERIIAEGRKDAARLNTCVYGDQTSPLFEESALRATAAAWGIEGALSDTVSEDELRNLLYSSVIAQQATKEKTLQGKGIDDFLQFISFDENIRARSLILEAIDKKIVRYDIPKFSYVFASSETPILVVPDKHVPRKFDYLCDTLLSKGNENLWERFRKETIDSKYIDGKDFKFVKWLAKADGLPIAAKSEAALRDALKARYI
jgi:hypothetical protein